MKHYILQLKQKAAINFIVTNWKKVDKKPSRQELWYPCYVQMMSTLKKLRKIIRKTRLPKPLKRYVLAPINDYDMLEKHAHDFYAEFDDHPSEYLEPFIIELERKNIRRSNNNQKKKRRPKKKNNNP